MYTGILTLGIAFVIVMVAIALLAIGWLITGRGKIRAGACGTDPTKKRDDKECGTNVRCDLCKRNDRE